MIDAALQTQNRCSCENRSLGLPRMITAHAGFAARGGYLDESEDNTLDNFIKAANSGVDAVEVDVRCYRAQDGAALLPLGHDEHTPTDATPTLGSALALLLGLHSRSGELNERAAKVRIQADCKMDRMIPHVLQAVRKASFPVSRLILAGDSSYEHVLECRDELTVAVDAGMDFWMNPNFILGYKEMTEETDRFIARIKALGLSRFTVNSSYRYMNSQLQKRFEDEGIGVSLWTLNDPQLLYAYMNSGLYNITTRLAEAPRIRQAVLDGGSLPAQTKSLSNESCL